MILKKILFYVQWLFKVKILGEKIPLNSSLIINDTCNLKCRHCVVSNLGYRTQTFEEVIKDISRLYEAGSRMLVITGGEPMLWGESPHGLNDVIGYARRRGFFRVVVCTNGTLPLESDADYLWVSLDGSFDEHNSIRGDIHESVVANIAASRHEHIYINFTISKINYAGFDSSAASILKLKNVRGILFHLFTPYIGADVSLSLDHAERIHALERLRRIKKKHPLRISNTFAGLRALKDNNWERNIWTSIVASQGQISSCCCRKGIYDHEVCEACGCSPAVETWVLQTLKPTAIIENLRFL